MGKLPTIYKIHPSIGVARVGNSPTDFFIGPETPGRPSEGVSDIGSKVPNFKDSSGLIKRQGARFRIWQYDDNGKGKYAPVAEINLSSSNVEWIVWTCHLANKKAAFFTFDGLRGDPVYGPSGAAPERRNKSVTNPKALWLDPGMMKISGKSKSGVEFKKGAIKSQTWPLKPPSPDIDYLGELRTDAEGRLIVLGGLGKVSSVPGANPIDNYANNDGWFDDVSDGPVNAMIKIKGIKNPIPAVGAWVLCGPPCFAPHSRNVVSLWDTLFDLAAREMTLPTNDAKYDGVLKPLADINAEIKGKAWGTVTLSKYTPVFETDIWPILQAALDVVYLYRPAKSVHGTLGHGGVASFYKLFADPAPANQSLRQLVFNQLHKPGVAGDGMPSTEMPKLLGDDPYNKWKVGNRRRLVLTPTQHAMLERWSQNKFTSTTTSPPALPAVSITPDGLDRAAMESCVGGAFFPGIECSWQIRHPALYLEPFRIKEGAPTQYAGDSGGVEAGHFSRQMALPWPADFLQCRLEDHKRDDTGVDTDWGWWPVPRPHHVYATEADATGAKSMVSWVRSTSGGAAKPWAGGGGEEPQFDEMVPNWVKFGFVIRKGDVMFETERAANVP
ncbi:MAG TPA: LodA/GoxA family CTQ-dependent oxidase [Fimbriimonadaceae bacterium]|nr:LodA/GoxA family CTQ-dependent oxidase [Fimbriimonadaceae bacterium]